MPYMIDGLCVYKKNKDGSKGEKKGCSETKEMAEKYMRKLYSIDESLQEIKDYFSKREDSDHMKYDGHELADVESLMDPDRPAPWDHEINTKNDGDVDVDVEE